MFGYRAWLPHMRWSNRNALVVQWMTPLVNGTATGYLINADMPLHLGQCHATKQYRAEDVKVVLQCNWSPNVMLGHVYTVIGACTPVFRDGCWHVQIPRAGRASGLVRNLGCQQSCTPTPSSSVPRFAEKISVPNHTAQKELPSVMSLSTVSPALDISSGFVDLVGVWHEVPTPSQVMTVQHWLRHWIQIPWENLWFLQGEEVVTKDSLIKAGCPMRLKMKLGARQQPFCKRKGDGHHADHIPCSGFVDLAGQFHHRHLPSHRCTLREWLGLSPALPCDNVWFTCDGKIYSLDDVIESGQHMIVRFRARLRGGGREQPDMKRLEQLLTMRGVPTAEAPGRAAKVLEAVGKEALQKALASVEPWRQIKSIVGQKIRLVLPSELQNSKKSSAKPADPFDECDPWAQALADKENESVDLRLDAGFFIDQSDAPLPIIDRLVVAGKGAALVSALDAEVFARIHGVSSEDEMVAVITGTTVPNVGMLTCEALTFPAWHKGSKVLVRGFAVQFGKSSSKISAAPKHYSLTVQDHAVISVEIRREYVKSWDIVTSNPYRHVVEAITGLQEAMKASWSRRYFQGRTPAKSADDAETWHLFMRVDKAAVDNLVKQSGVAGTFITPKDATTYTASGLYKVIWLPSADLDQGMTVLKSIQESCGLVRGKTSLGLRVKAEHYSSVRVRLEPQWKPANELVNVAVEKRWMMTPIPQEMDRSAMQELLQQMGWRATPLKQVSGVTWTIGSGNSDPPPNDTVYVGGSLALISEMEPHHPSQRRETVVAGPIELRRALDRQLAGRKPSAFSSQSSAAPTTVSTTSSGPTLALMQDLRKEMEEKISAIKGDFDVALGNLTNRFEQHEASVAEQCAEAKVMAEESVQATRTLMHQQEQVAQQIAQISQSAITKVDLQEALSEQCKEIKALLLRAAPEAPSANEARPGRAAPY